MGMSSSLCGVFLSVALADKLDNRGLLFFVKVSLGLTCDLVGLLCRCLEGLRGFGALFDVGAGGIGGRDAS